MFFETGLAALGAGAATARAGGGAGSAGPAAISPGGFVAGGPATGSTRNPFAPTHPAGIAFWIGVGSVAAFCFLYYSLPS